jgi:hypothetical protein
VSSPAANLQQQSAATKRNLAVVDAIIRGVNDAQ